mmetsp:Transcript_17102/g.18556  ORF Transcript_17102/g.18556 Transcript_17102/m.18556 type:complete len:305 (+) Transcript_17102:134-1048(+)
MQSKLRTSTKRSHPSKRMSLYKIALTNSSYNSSIDYQRSHFGKSYDHRKMPHSSTSNKNSFVEGKIYYFINEAYYAFYPNDSFHYYRIIENQTEFLDQSDTDNWVTYNYTSSVMAEKSVLQHFDQFIAILDYEHMEVITYVRKEDYEQALIHALRPSASNSTTLTSPVNSIDEEDCDSSSDDEFDLIDEFDESRRKTRIDAAILEMIDVAFLNENGNHKDQMIRKEDQKYDYEEPSAERKDGNDEIESELVLFDYSWNKENDVSSTPTSIKPFLPSPTPFSSSTYCGKSPSYRLKKRRFNQEIC